MSKTVDQIWQAVQGESIRAEKQHQKTQRESASERICVLFVRLVFEVLFCFGRSEAIC